MRKMSVLDWIAWVLVIIGGLSWGLIGIFNLDIVGTLFGAMSTFSRLLYILVGLSALYILFASFIKAPANTEKPKDDHDDVRDDDENDEI